MTDDSDDETSASPAAATAEASTEDHSETKGADAATASEDDGLAGLSPTTEADARVETADTEGQAAADDDGGRDLVTYVEWAAFGILCLLALVATFRFYFAASEAIRVWFSRDFVPVFQAVFNLVILVLAALGISVLVRRLS